MKICKRCKQEKEQIEFSKSKLKSGKTRLHAYCIPCRRQYDNEWYQQHKLTIYKNKKKRNHKRRILLKEYIFQYLLKHPCVDCGQKDPLVLEFDHQKDKKHNISCMVLHYGIKSLKNEISKCKVRCANCHRKKTHRSFKTWKYKRSVKKF